MTFSPPLQPVHRRGQPNPGSPKRRVLAELTYATVQKIVAEGRGVEVQRELVLGSEANLQAALAQSPVSRTINTALVERHNGTDRQRGRRA